MPSPRSITISDLAARLQLDKSSVSLALRDSHKISDATKLRVRELADRLGYHPNLAARQLKSGRSHIVGLVFSPSFESLHNTVVVRSVQALVRLAAGKNWLFSMLSGGDVPDMLDGHAASPFLADGILAWGDVPAESLQPILERRKPVVVLDPNHPSLAAVDCARVEIENRAGATAIVEHLAARGAKRLLFVQARRDHLGHEERWIGAQNAWKQTNPAAAIERIDLESVTDAHLSAFAATANGAIFASNDQAAMAIWHRLVRLGIAVPNQVRLAGFDGDAYGAQIGLTTATFDPDELANAAVTILEQRWNANGTTSPEIRIPVSLRAGETT